MRIGRVGSPARGLAKRGCAMEPNGVETEELLRRAGNGDDGAVRRLFERHRGRLRRVVAARLDRRVAARLDPSDVVQEALGEANEKLAGFLRDRPVPFYSWLRRLDAPPPQLDAPVPPGIAQANRRTRGESRSRAIQRRVGGDLASTWQRHQPKRRGRPRRGVRACPGRPRAAGGSRPDDPRAPVCRAAVAGRDCRTAGDRRRAPSRCGMFGP